MNQIFKTWKKATYFEGTFTLLDKKTNTAPPIDFPTVFVAFGQGIRSGNWQRCTAINTPDYVVEHFFDGKPVRHLFWQYCRQLEDVTWEDVEENKQQVLKLVNLANNELIKLPQL